MDKKKSIIYYIFISLILLLLIQLTIPSIKVILHFVKQISFPIIVGFLFAFLIYPLAKMFNKKIDYKKSVILSFLIFIFLLILLFSIILPNLYRQLIIILTNMPMLIDKFEQQITSILKKDFNYISNYFQINLEEYLKNKIVMLEEVAVNSLKSVVKIIFNFVLSLIISAYILVDFDKIIIWLKAKTIKKPKIRFFLKRMKDLMYSYISGSILVSLIMFITSSILFEIIGLDYAFFLGFIFALTNFIPYVGPYIGGIFVVIAGMIISLKKALFSLLIVFLLQLIESNYITPKIQSRMLKIKPFYLIISVIILGELLGIFGMVISIPLVVFFQTIFDVFLSRKNIIKN